MALIGTLFWAAHVSILSVILAQMGTITYKNHVLQVIVYIKDSIFSEPKLIIIDLFHIQTSTIGT
jgi:hypothetical protein